MKGKIKEVKGIIFDKVFGKMALLVVCFAFGLNLIIYGWIAIGLLISMFSSIFLGPQLYKSIKK